MADWYASSAAYSAIPTWAAATAYTVGQFVRPTAPANTAKYAFRVTTGGTSGGTEPTWPAGNNATVTGGATFTNVTGQSTYGWSAAAGTLTAISNAASNRPAAGDSIFLSSDHNEGLTAGTTIGFGSAAYGLIQVISVNRAGSVPPVAADIQSGAVLGTTTGNLTLENLTEMFWQGITFSLGGSSSASIFHSSSGQKAHYMKDCAYALTNTNAASRLQLNANASVIWDNTSLSFGATAQLVSFTAPTQLHWINTPTAVRGATLPATLFGSTAIPALVTARGVDLSSVTGTLVASGTCNKILLDSCRIASGLARLPTLSGPSADEVELVNCYNGTAVINERNTAAGTVTTDSTTYLIGGAQDDIGNYSLKLVSSSRSDFCALALDSFWIDVENTAIGSSKTATVEIVSSGTLNNNDIRLILEYMGTSGNPVASFGDSLATVLTAASALPSSSSTWNSPPATPQKQLLQVTFTPQRAGRVRGLVRLGKVSTTVWVNPQITIS